MNERILIVEDEGLLAKELRAKLIHMGYEVTGLAVSGEEALQRAEENPPDLVLMDIHLAGEMDGIETASQILKRFQIPAIYLTAYSDPQTVQRAKFSYSFAYILKPLRERELETNIEIALYRHRTETELHRYRELLEQVVEERTRELRQTNRHLQQELSERKQSEEN